MAGFDPAQLFLGVAPKTGERLNINHFVKMDIIPHFMIAIIPLKTFADIFKIILPIPFAVFFFKIKALVHHPQGIKF